jgi:hypothetical protein
MAVKAGSIKGKKKKKPDKNTSSLKTTSRK